MAKFEKVFIAGTMQGASSGVEIRDQSYRELLSTILRTHNPDIEIVEPHVLMQDFIAGLGMPLATGYMKLAELPIVEEKTLESEVLLLRKKFRELTALSGECDLCVAFLPDEIPSMGTAMEMYATHIGGGTVASITAMRQNLSILSTSDVIVADIEAFARWLADVDR